MNDWLINYAELIRLGSFIGVFVLLATIELRRPQRRLSAGKGGRWLNNVGVVLVNNVLLKLLLPLLAIDVAAMAQQQQWGLINQFPLTHDLTYAVIVLMTVILLDAAIYAQHRLFHRLPLLWRLHRMHHSDIDIDVSTAIRFHPLEIIMSMLIKMAIVLLLGAPVVAVLLFELLLNLTAMFSHSNIRLNPKLDRYLRYLLVTPDMHRVHHSVDGDETNHNFGFCLSCWDRIFHSYQAQPKLGHQQMCIGLPYFRGPHECQLQYMLSQPFRQGK